MKAIGLLCQSDISTAVCVPVDPRSMIVHRRQEKKYSGEHSKLMDKNYSNLALVKSKNTSEQNLTAVTLAMVTKNDNNDHIICPSISQPNDHHLQVVVMRVSIHCQGCARKVSKHISKIEGVTSFDIDLESKKVTVMGHLSPTQLIQSISKANIRAELIN